MLENDERIDPEILARELDLICSLEQLKAKILEGDEVIRAYNESVRKANEEHDAKHNINPHLILKTFICTIGLGCLFISSIGLVLIFKKSIS
jgi:hypothetical protein